MRRVSALRDLADVLGVPENKVSMVAGLADTDLHHLRDSVKAAMATQDTAIERGVERALSAIPKPLRGKARSMIFPGSPS